MRFRLSRTGRIALAAAMAAPMAACRPARAAEPNVRTEEAQPADMVPRARPRMMMTAEELPRRIAWARPGGPLNGYLEQVRRKVLTNAGYSAWFRSHAALAYLLTGEEALADRACKPKDVWAATMDQDPVVYDWLVAGDDYWKKSAFPAAERRRYEERLAAALAPANFADDRNPWSAGSYNPLAHRLAAARALIGVPEYDAKAREAFNSNARFAAERFLPAWNVPGGFMPCGASYGEAVEEGLGLIHAMLDGCSGRFDPWATSRYAQERVRTKLAEETPHTGLIDGLGGLPEMHGDVKDVPYGDIWSVGVFTRAFKDPLGQWYLRTVYPLRTRLGPDGGGAELENRAFIPLLFVDPDVRCQGPKEAPLPLVHYRPYHRPWAGRADAEGSGQVMMRSHWGDPNQTCVYFRCGDFFDGHQDVGNLHFSLYRKGYFAVAAASRHTYDSANWREIVEFNHTSLPRNTIQVYDTDMPRGPWGAQKISFEGSQNHYCHRGYARGGHIDALETGPDYTYVNADATPMYKAMYVDQGNPNRDRAREVRRQFVYVRSRPAGSDDVLVVFDRVDENVENFQVQSPLKIGGASARWLLNVATTPRRGGQALQPGIRTFQSAGEADTYTLPAGGLWPGEERADSQCHVQALLPARRTVRWVGGVDPNYDVPSRNLIAGLYRIRLTAASAKELREHPDFGEGPVTERYTYRLSNRAGRVETELPFFDPSIGLVRCGFWLRPASEARKLAPGEFLLWQARVTADKLEILLNGKAHAEYPFEKFPTLGAMEKEMHATLRTPGNPGCWTVALIRGYEWWADNWREPSPPGGALGDPHRQGFAFDDPAGAGWPIAGGALDGGMFGMGGIYARAYPLYAHASRSQRGWKQVCGLWRMETMPRAEDNRPKVHFLHVLSPVDKGVAPPRASCEEGDERVTVTIRTAKGRTIVVAFNKLGRPAGGHIRIDRPDKVDRDLREGHPSPEAGDEGTQAIGPRSQ